MGVSGLIKTLDNRNGGTACVAGSMRSVYRAACAFMSASVLISLVIGYSVLIFCRQIELCDIYHSPKADVKIIKC